MKTTTRWKLAAALAAIVLLSSCMPAFSIHGFATVNDMIFDRSLLGTWNGEDDSGHQNSVFIEEMLFAGKPGYLITLHGITAKPASPELAEKYEAQLFQLGDTRFLDLIQSHFSSGDEELTIAAQPMHMVAELSLQGGTLQLHFLDDDWLRKNLSGGNGVLAHETEEGTPILTASTADLQKFLLAHAKDAEAFSVDIGPFQRQQ